MIIEIYNIQKKIKINTHVLGILIKRLCFILKIKKGYLSIVLTGNENISLMNKKYLGKNSSTDVLSFNMQDSFDAPGVFGEIIISSEKAVENAFVFNNELDKELLLYIIHGLLHITGFNDTTVSEEGIMRKEERRLLALLSKKEKHLVKNFLQ